MIDISKQKINLNCPGCNYKITVNLAQVSREEVVICSNCKQEIKLKDSKGSTRKGIRDINKAFDDLEKTIKSFGKIK